MTNCVNRLKCALTLAVRPNPPMIPARRHGPDNSVWATVIVRQTDTDSAPLIFFVSFAPSLHTFVFSFIDTRRALAHSA